MCTFFIIYRKKPGSNTTELSLKRCYAKKLVAAEVDRTLDFTLILHQFTCLDLNRIYTNLKELLN